jgi:hypothetical protein
VRGFDQYDADLVTEPTGVLLGQCGLVHVTNDSIGVLKVRDYTRLAVGTDPPLKPYKQIEFLI